MDTLDHSRPVAVLPSWVPVSAKHYIEHTSIGLPIRALARAADVHPSTILRQIRKCETRRDDPLVDGALRALADDIDNLEGGLTVETIRRVEQEARQMMSDCMRVLLRLAEIGAVLAVARDMEKGVVVREGADGVPQRLAVADRPVAQVLALQDWIICHDVEARVTRYQITNAGRSALKDHMAAQENTAQGFGAGNTPHVADGNPGFLMRPRAGLPESPLTSVARRKDKDGTQFLSRSLVAAGERLREDYEISQMNGPVPFVLDHLLATPPKTLSPISPKDPAARAKLRVEAALQDLGPGLADVALRTCCHLEGMERLEDRMGWSARSGKIVLRIALQRLVRHYADQNGGLGPKIG